MEGRGYQTFGLVELQVILLSSLRVSRSQWDRPRRLQPNLGLQILDLFFVFEYMRLCADCGYLYQYFVTSKSLSGVFRTSSTKAIFREEGHSQSTQITQFGFPEFPKSTEGIFQSYSMRQCSGLPNQQQHLIGLLRDIVIRLQYCFKNILFVKVSYSELLEIKWCRNYSK